MKRRENQSPQAETARILVEFLEVAITSIVSLKGVYPPGAFERRRYMNIVVQKARHPQLREYIHSAVIGLLPHIHKDLVERVAVIFFHNDNSPVERFIFKLSLNSSYGSKVEEANLEFALRSFLIKLPLSESLTKVLPQTARRGMYYFGAAFVCKDDCYVRIGCFWNSNCITEGMKSKVATNYFLSNMIVAREFVVYKRGA